MASKHLGKSRQWAEERISSPSVVMDEFKEFENDIETAKTRHFEVRSFIIHTLVHVYV
ncbi:hypothetical protein PISMIDRAFT_10194 [Pisolithus microcarpus 441]|uniref:Uncharacterized protein n=1 Tax=Pisolithus microcarpus 441 TaxID=765257 RepID=A0A0C9ZF79_9AGAM|nr:hypothetical protein PISMIDRAFT_10194 [Pisolithus microcarpus 441]